MSMQTGRKFPVEAETLCLNIEQIVNASQERRSQKASTSREPVPTENNLCQFGEKND